MKKNKLMSGTNRSGLIDTTSINSDELFLGVQIVMALKKSL